MAKLPDYTIDKKFERIKAQDVLSKVEEQKYSLASCEWCVSAFVSLTGFALQSHNTDAMADFLDDGGCEALVTILGKYAAVSVDVAVNGLMTVCILAWSLREMKEFLGEIGACEVVVFATSLHVGEPRVSECGSAAIALLARNNIANSFKLAEAGACDVLAQVGNFGFNLRHSACTAVATHVCLAFAQLAEAKNAARLLECGAPNLIVELVKFHFNHKEFAAAATKAMCGLASLNVTNREELGKVGACEYILDILNLHEDVAITQEACECVMHLSLSPSNTSRLGEAGANESVVEALRTKLMEQDFGPEVCSGAMLNMATYGVAATENRERLVSAGAIEQLRLARLSTKVSYKARENVSNLLLLLGAEMVPGSVSSDSVKMSGTFVGVIHGSEVKGDTLPLSVEVTEVVEEEEGVADGGKSRSASRAVDVLMQDQDDGMLPEPPAQEDLMHSPVNAVHEI